MLRVGQRWKTSGPLVDTEAVSERAPGIGAWGEGLIDRSLTSLWYPAEWSEVGDDELVFLLPALSRWQPAHLQTAARGNDGPARYLTRVLTARASATAALISSNVVGDEMMKPARVLQLLVTRGILTTIALEDLATATLASRRPPRLPIVSLSESAEGNAQCLPDWLALELTALAHLDRLLLDARGATRGADASPLLDWPLSLADVVVATIHARLNGAYVHPEFAHAHELLTAAALLGHLVYGRTAYIPPHIAQTFVDLLSGDGKAGSGEDDWCAAIVRMFVGLAGGTDHILSLARRSVASGRPCFVRPRRTLTTPDTGRKSWNARLLERIVRRWHVSA